MDELTRLKLLKLKQLEEQERLREGLPHKYTHKFYPWQRRFLNSENPLLVLCCANQQGKSAIQIIKMITWATEPELWPKLWPTLKKGQAPGQMWYIYPTREIATIEAFEKWHLYLPRGEFKNDPRYGYEIEIDNKKIFAIHFNSGVSCYFKTYAQDQEKLQGGTCYYIACDEELPAELFDELSLRVAATDGKMSFVFTATQGQEFWRQVVEDRKRLPDAEVIQASMFDSLFYEDGTPSSWTKERIERIIARCSSEAEVQRRVYGKFAVDEGLKYALFSRTKNVVKPYVPPKDWLRYAGIDLGGGGSGHPSAITFVAVRPDFQKGVVYKSWRGAGELTTAQDVLQLFLEMRAGETLVGVYYDHAAKDFSTIAHRAGISVIKAEKSHDIGEGTLNALFKNQMLEIHDTFDTLIQEFLSLLSSTDKRKAKDDQVDSLRYAVSLVPWDWSHITLTHDIPEKKKVWTEADERKSGIILLKDPHENNQDEFEFWNEMGGT